MSEDLVKEYPNIGIQFLDNGSVKVSLNGNSRIIKNFSEMDIEKQRHELDTVIKILEQLPTVNNVQQISNNMSLRYNGNDMIIEFTEDFVEGGRKIVIPNYKLMTLDGKTKALTKSLGNLMKEIGLESDDD